MCILFIYTDPNPQPNGFRLIIASNRDEYYKRPAQPVSRRQNVIGGRDMEAGRDGGMWLGISLPNKGDIKLKFGALLNITGENRKHGTQGRGFIVTNYLNDDVAANKYMKALVNSEAPYSGYNLVAVEVRDYEITTYHCSNTTDAYITYKGKQILGFGNTPPEVPITKVLKGKEKFEEIIDKNNNITNQSELTEKLLEFLKCEDKHLPDPELEKRQPMAYEHLSSIYVKIVNAGYGTRTHSIILVDYDWNVEFFESTMKEPIDIEQPVWLTDVIRARL